MVTLPKHRRFIMRKNDGQFEDTHILLPMPPTDMGSEFEMEVYVRFMRCIRQVSSKHHDMGILVSIQFVADMINVSQVHVTKILVGLGLRAPRLAFPEAYLQTIERSSLRDMLDAGYSDIPLRDLRHHWQAIREDRFLSFGLSA